ncbi:MAG TPA: UDP-3-O-acyl-N-acetylglucosamine deacetylase [Acetobacteraceae bacterium]
MDGLPQPLDSGATTWCQQTLKAPIGCVGVGLHTGRRVSLTFRPAPVDHGVVFRRTDLGSDIPARFDCVVDTRLSTVLAHGNARIGTVEHVMAALAGCGIDNALVEVDGPEPPILDGSAAQFVFLLDCAGTVAQDVPRATIEIRRPVRVSDGDAFAELRPGGGALDMDISIDFDAAAIGRQALSLRLTPESFRHELARARTFTLAEEIDELRASGLAQGGSLENAVVVDQARVLNPAGLRVPDEFVRHKLLDAVGDLALAGAPLHGRFIAHRSGHTLNNRLVRALFADRSAWREIAPAQLSVAAE